MRSQVFFPGSHNGLFFRTDSVSHSYVQGSNAVLHALALFTAGPQYGEDAVARAGHKFYRKSHQRTLDKRVTRLVCFEFTVFHKCLKLAIAHHMCAVLGRHGDGRGLRQERRGAWLGRAGS